LLACHNEKSVSVIKNNTVEKWDYLASHLFLVKKWDTSLKNGTVPLKTGHLVSLKYNLNSLIFSQKK
jgi:hypothetical protein